MGNIFSKLTNLTILNLERNKLSGQLPINALTVISNLAELHLSQNRFEGSIPTIVSNFKKLNLLKLTDVNITGSIPSEIGKLTSLNEFRISENSITGSIPDSIYRLSALTYLSFRSNKLTGTIPTFFGLFTKLEYFNVFDNYFEGTIPTELGNMSSLFYLYSQSNRLNGTIPLSVWRLEKLRILYLFDNYLTGSIPELEIKLFNIAGLDLSSNYLTGTIPSSLMFLPIQQLILSDNYFTGNLPEFKSICNHLNLLNINHNYFSGTLPISIISCSKMKNMFISENKLSGSLESYFNSSNFPLLQSIDISKNRFSGNFPSSIFKCPGLKFVYAGLNCFRSFPGDSICDASNLTSLVLDGLTVSKSCRTEVLSFSDSYLSPYLDATLPNCIFSLSYLSTIQISGLGLTGELSHDERLNPNAKFIRLSHNNIGGVIPSSFMRKNLTVLDLSANFISGEWDYINSTSLEITLYSNRLSGLPPPNADQLTAVNVLSGNRFACSNNREVTNDPYKSRVTCGSIILDIPLIIWGVQMFISSVVFLYCCIYIKKRLKLNFYLTFTKFLKMSPDQIIIQDELLIPLDSKFREFINCYYTLVRLIFIIGVVIFFVYLPIYGTMSNRGYDSHKNTYSWQFSAAFFIGIVPAVIMIIPYWLIVLKLMFVSRKIGLYRTSDKKSVSFKDSIKLLFRVYSINISVVLMTDYFYIAREESENTSEISRFFLQVTYSLWTVFWDLVAVPLLLKYFKASPGQQFKGRIGCRLFSLIVASSLTTLLADPLCYRYLLESAPTIESSYTIPQCTASIFSDGNIVCVRQGVLAYTTVFTPPFIYSRLCSSAIITNFSPVIIYSSIFQTISYPLLHIIAAKLFKNGKRAFGLPHMLWAPDPAWSPSEKSQYLKLPKTFASAFYYLALLLTFGILNPLIVAPVLVAFAVEVLTNFYLIRRFLIMLNKYQNNPEEDNIIVKIVEVLSLVKKETNAKVHRESNPEVSYEKSDSQDSTCNFERKKYENVLEKESANNNIEIIRPVTSIIISSSIFLSFYALDMSSVYYGTWKKNIFFFPLSVIIPLIGLLYIHYYRKVDVLKALNERSFEVEMNSMHNPIANEDEEEKKRNSDDSLQY